MATKSEEQEYIDSNIVELSDRNFQIIKRTFEVHLDDLLNIKKNNGIVWIEEEMEERRKNGDLTLKSDTDAKNQFYVQLELYHDCIRCFIYFKKTIIICSIINFEELWYFHFEPEYATYIENLFSM